MGFNPSQAGQTFTVESVEEELSRDTLAQLRLRMSKEKGELRVQPPTTNAIQTVEEAARRTGDRGSVSIADRDVVALAIDLKASGLEPLIVSDDYALQNLAEHLGLAYGSLANFGIVHKFEWIMYCPACHRKFQPPEKTCRVCGTTLKRRVISKTKATKAEQRGKPS